MFIDLSVFVSKASRKSALDSEKIVAYGHMGTHFDVMNQSFPLDLLRRDAIVFDVRSFASQEIDLAHINLDLIEPHSFVAFCSGYSSICPYGTKDYFANHPQLSHLLIDALLHKEISILGVDFAGVRRGVEHTSTDQRCADQGVFIVENLCNLESVLNGLPYARCLIYTFPVNFDGMTGLPCRVVAEF